MTDLVVHEPQESIALPSLDIAALERRIASIDRVIGDLMTQDIHYGQAFPGADRHSLLQPGAELIVEAFGLVPRPKITVTDEGGGHRHYLCEGGLYTAHGGLVGEMSAECSTLEPKYRYRWKRHACPNCRQETLLKNKEAGKGWFCWRKKGGCGATFKDGDPAIEDQELGKVEYEDPAEYYHTCRMMAQKRWLVGITRRTFGLSARFVDAEGYAKQSFDWERRATPLLAALPGDRREKWARVQEYCLAEFGREARHLTNVEGAIVLDWLQQQVGVGRITAADLEPPGQEPAPAKADPKPSAKAEPKPPAPGLPYQLDLRQPSERLISEAEARLKLGKSDVLAAVRTVAKCEPAKLTTDQEPAVWAWLEDRAGNSAGE